MPTFTDAEQRFAGRQLVAKAKRDFNVAQGYKGGAARPWTDTMEADVIRAGVVEHHRSQLARIVADAGATDALATAKAGYETAQAVRKQAVRDASRNPHGR